MPLTKVKSGGVSDSITLTSPDINAPDIDGGTIDNAVIGGSTAAAGSFTTITATGGSSSNWNTAYGWGDHSTQSYATQTYVGTAVSNLVDSSPAALDTLNELAAALGDDPNFATTVTNSIALKAPLASPSFTGNVLVGRTSSLSSQSGSVSANTVVSAHGGLQSHATSAGILEHYNDETLLRSYGANAGSGKLVFKVGGGGGSTDSEAMRIDSSGNVGVGTASPTLASAWNKVLHVQSAGAGSSIRLADSASGTSGEVGLLMGQYSNSSYIINRDSSNMYFWTGGQERVRLDSSGNLLVGTTDDVVWNNSANSAADNGHNLRDDGRAGFAYYNATANSNATVNINRTGSDGDLIRLFKSGTNVGSIGTVSGDIVVGTGNTGLRFYDAGRAIQPRHTDGSAANDVIDLGMSANRFKDLYLSGAVNLTNSTTTAFTQAGSNMFQLGTNSADPAVFYTSGAERARIDSSGNLLVGTTATDTAAVGFRYRSSLDAISSVADGGISAYFGRRTSDGDIVAFRKDDATVGSIGNYGGLALDVGKGTTAVLRFRDSLNAIYPAAGVAGGTSDGVTSLGISSGRFKDLWVTRTHLANNSTSYWTLDRDDNDGSLTVDDTGTERMRIDPSGNLLVGTTNVSASVGEGIKFRTSSNGKTISTVSSRSTSADEGITMWSTGANTWRFYVGWGGKINATSNTIQAISDQRFKENIRDLDDGLSKVMELRPRKFDWKEGKGADIKDDRGFIAQEFEEVFPDLVGEWKDEAPEGEEPYKAVSQDLIPTLVKAIQEQQTLIESLTARIAALEE